MDSSEFVRCIERLTGTPVKELEATALDALTKILADGEHLVDCSQLNELLLLVNKDRLSHAFFEYFFTPPCRINDIPASVERFQRAAMLRYGNFIYAFRRLSRTLNRPELLAELGELFRDSAEITAEFEARPERLLEIIPISRADTPLVGYLSAANVTADHQLASLLRAALGTDPAEKPRGWPEFENRAMSLASPEGKRNLSRIIELLRERCHESLGELHDQLRAVEPSVEARLTKLQEVRAQARANEDTYLTWDHMDVYFATSMRKRADYEEVHDFVNELMTQPELAELRLRWFDPTQSFNDVHLDKGLVESLMLKRAKCTVYSVQDIDTLGKDSELAATLAQGKTVIAYVPDRTAGDRAAELLSEDVATLHERLRFVHYFHEPFTRDLSADDREVVRVIQEELQRAELECIWLSVPDPGGRRIHRNPDQARRFCELLAEAEKAIYDKRARTLKEQHPLGIQVNLATGVANGVLVVRDVPACAKLLRSVLTNGMEFLDISAAEDKRMWYLREKHSGSVFRIVTKDRKLTNCFWNYYRERN